MNAPSIAGSQRFASWRRLAAGQGGETWRATMQPGDREVVVKLVPALRAAEIAPLLPTFRERGLNDHPALQPFLEIEGPGGGSDAALVFGFVEGPTLRQTLDRDGPMGSGRVRALGTAILSGLGALHGHGLVHRDVTPENIVLTPAGPVLIDYGALRELSRKATYGQTTIGGEVAGKFLYMAPEQMAGAPQSSAVDIWALGAVLYEAATGRRLRGTAPLAEIFAAAVAPADLSGAPAGLRPALAAMLAVDPAARPDARAAIAQLALLSLPEEWDELLRRPFGGAPAAPSPSPRRPEPLPDDPFSDPFGAGSPPPAAPSPAQAHPWPLPDHPATDDPFPDPSRAGSPPPAPPRPAPMPRPAASAPRRRFLLAGLPVALLLAGAAGYLVLSGGWRGSGNGGGSLPHTGTTPPPPILTPDALGLMAAGILLALAGLALWSRARSREDREAPPNPFRAASLHGAPDARELLTKTILVSIDALYARMRGPGGGMLAIQMAALAQEYSEADSAQQRLEALKMLNDLHLRAATQTVRWWQSWDTAAGRAASLTSLAAGLVALAEGLRRLL